MHEAYSAKAIASGDLTREQAQSVLAPAKSVQMLPAADNRVPPHRVDGYNDCSCDNIGDDRCLLHGPLAKKTKTCPCGNKFYGDGAFCTPCESEAAEAAEGGDESEEK